MPAQRPTDAYRGRHPRAKADGPGHVRADANLVRARRWFDARACHGRCRRGRRRCRGRSRACRYGERRRPRWWPRRDGRQGQSRRRPEAAPPGRTRRQLGGRAAPRGLIAMLTATRSPPPVRRNRLVRYGDRGQRETWRRPPRHRCARETTRSRRDAGCSGSPAPPRRRRDRSRGGARRRPEARPRPGSFRLRRGVR